MTAARASRKERLEAAKAEASGQTTDALRRLFKDTVQQQDRYRQLFEEAVSSDDAARMASAEAKWVELDIRLHAIRSVIGARGESRLNVMSGRSVGR